jgi:hypothetical protein
VAESVRRLELAQLGYVNVKEQAAIYHKGEEPYGGVRALEVATGELPGSTSCIHRRTPA